MDSNGRFCRRFDQVVSSLFRLYFVFIWIASLFRLDFVVISYNLIMISMIPGEFG